jgi:hypothetical protein
VTKEETNKPTQLGDSYTKSIKLGDLYTKAQDDLKYNGDKAWETIKLCITLFSTLLTAFLGLLTAINFLGKSLVFVLIPIPFPIMMIIIVYFLSKNFERECSRMYENVTILMKIEDELPHRKDLREERNFKEENDYIPKKWKEIQYSDTEEFVKVMMDNKKKDSFFSNLKAIFSILLGFSCVLLLITCIIAIIIAHFPYQTIDIILIVVSLTFVELVLFYTPMRTFLICYVSNLLYKFLRLLSLTKAKVSKVTEKN